MKKLIRLLLTSIIALTSCNNQQTNTANNKATYDMKWEAKKLMAFMKKYEEPSQTFIISANKPTQIKGKQGAIISINPINLVTESGQPLGNNIEVELKELTNQDQLLKTSAQTVSSGQLLVSGGAYFINMTSDGQQLKIKEGKYLQVELPKLSDNEMFLFYGQRDSLGQMEWKQADQVFKTSQSLNNQLKSLPKKDTLRGEWNGKSALTDYKLSDTSKPMTKEEKEKYERDVKLEKKVYDAINLKNFGWINCDRFPEIPNKTSLFVKFNPADSILYANTYLVFKDINSVMQAGYSGTTSGTANYNFGNIPVGYKVRLIAYTVKGEKVYCYSTELTVQALQTMTLIMKETSEQEFKNLLGKN